MKILLTGGTGFLGTNLIKSLIDQGHHLTLILRRSSNLTKLSEVLNQCSIYWKEEMNSIDAPFITDNFDSFIHCATNYGRNNATLSQVLEDNLIWPVQLLELCISKNVPLFINTDTFFTKAGPDYEYLKSYVISKYYFREILTKYSQYINIANLRLEHVYGPNDGEGKFTTWVIEQLRSSETIEMTSGIQKRDFIHINDVVHAYNTILKNKDKINGFMEFEVGLGESHSIREFVEMVKLLLNSNSSLAWGALQLRNNEFMDSKADNSNLRKLGWQPDFSFEEGVKQLIDYYLN